VHVNTNKELLSKANLVIYREKIADFRVFALKVYRIVNIFNTRLTVSNYIV